MSRIEQSPRYVIISPVKDEERWIELTLASVVAQTVKPVLWLIVDDGSKDSTAEIVGRYQNRHPFIRLLQCRRSGARATGSAEAQAFKYGYDSLGTTDYEFIIKLDGDLSFGPEHLAGVLQRFREDPTLGIASGIYCELSEGDVWKHVRLPWYHAFGACKVVRRSCFEEIGGFLTAPGWDTVDEIRAWHRGWSTRHFDDLEVKHHKPEGSSMGALRTSRMHGEIYFVTGGDPVLLVPKLLRRAAMRPVLVSAAALASGYLCAVFSRKPRLVTPSEARSYRRLLRRRVFGRQAIPPDRIEIR